MKRTLALIQARMSSSRLPGKVLMDVGGEPMLLRVVRRARQAETLDGVAVITSVHPEDDALEAVCRNHEVPCFRGSLDDVLDRYYQAALHYQAEVIVRITADCPLLDPAVVDCVTRTFLSQPYDYVSNTIVCTFPDGLDTEVFSREALERAWREARLRSEREHVTPYILKHPESFRLGNVAHPEDLSELRWTVDTPSDLAFVRAVYECLPAAGFTMDALLHFLNEHPEIAALNTGSVRNDGYRKSLQEDSKTPLI